MSEYIVELNNNAVSGGKFLLGAVYLDAQEIVRCRNCAYYDGEPDLESSMPKCWRDPDHRGTAIWTRPDGFCAWGERRVDA